MARLYYPATELIVATGSGSPAVLTLSPAAEFSVWNSETGGSKLTDLKAADGVTNLPTNGAGNPFTDSNGWPPDLWGPDGVTGVLWRQVGTQRSPMVPTTELHTVLTTAARTNATTNFSGAVSFTSATAVAFTITPVVNGQTVITSGNLATKAAEVPQQILIKNATGDPWYIYVNPTTGVWPNSGARVAANGTALTGFTGRVIWDSQGYIGALKPAGMIDGDFWDERVA